MLCGHLKFRMPQLNMEGAIPEKLMHAVCTPGCGCTRVTKSAMPLNSVPCWRLGFLLGFRCHHGAHMDQLKHSDHCQCCCLESPHSSASVHDNIPHEPPQTPPPLHTQSCHCRHGLQTKMLDASSAKVYMAALRGRELEWSYVTQLVDPQ